MNGTSRITLWFLAACAVVTLCTGLIGWTKFYALSGYGGFWDALYLTLLAFTGDGSYVARAGSQDLNGWIATARFTGLVTTFSAIASIVFSVMGLHILRRRAERMKDHTVLIGASRYAVDMVDAGRPLVVFDTADRLEKLTFPKRAGSVLLIPDAMTGDTATGATLGAPDQVIFGDTDTATNVERARTWLAGTPGRNAGIRLALRIEDNSIARDLHLLSPDFAKATLISRSDTVARALVTSMAPTALAGLRGQARVHVVLIGMGSTNLAIAEELALRCHSHRLTALHLTIIDQDTDAARTRLRRERPDLENPDFGDNGFRIGFVEMDALEYCAAGQAATIKQLETEMPVTAVVVAAGSDARNTAIAMRLRQLQVEQLCFKAPIFMRSDSQSSVAAAPFRDLTGGVVPFGGRTLDAEDHSMEAVYEDLAGDIHNRWRLSPDVEKTPENDWQNMSTAARRASYRAALSAVEIFYAAGFAPPAGEYLAGLRLEPGAANNALGDDALIDDLSRTEHERWNAERRLEGFAQASDGIRDNEKKKHPLLVSYDDLTPEQKEKDEINVRAALHTGIARHEADPGKPCWRQRLRIGVIGPLQVDTTETRLAVTHTLDQLLAGMPDGDRRTLEILTPNAPGFDRLAAVHLAQAWEKKTGRPASVILLDAAGVSTVDRIAAAHLGAGKEVHKINDLLDDMRSESEQISELRTSGHRLFHLDMRPPGWSDAELERDGTAYENVIRGVQQLIIDVADHLIVDTRDGTAKWSLEASRTWETTKGTPARIV